MTSDMERGRDPYGTIQKSDVTLKHLLNVRNSSFVRMVTGHGSARAEPTEMTVARTVHADNLLRTPDGVIWHIEFQNWNDHDMPWRMVEYKSLILMREHVPRRRPFRLPSVRQVLIWTGNGTNPYRGTFAHDRLSLGFDSWDIRDRAADGRDLIASGQLTDRILGLLCLPKAKSRGEQERILDVWRRVAAYIVEDVRPEAGLMDAKMLLELAAEIRSTLR